MDTQKLDNYVFESFEKIKGLPIERIKFIIGSEKKLDEDFIVDLFEGLDISFREYRHTQKEYDYILTVECNRPIEGEEYALLLGKVFILCGKLFLNLKTGGIEC